jgi:hypothetical protein
MSYYGQAQYGIKLSDLSYEVLEKIIAIYDSTTGGKGIKRLFPGLEKKVKDAIQRDRFVEYRYGSWLTEHSKIEIRTARMLDPENDESDIDWLIYFKFSANIAISTDKAEEEAARLHLDFARKLEAFFLKKNIGIKLEK